jgi:hypothetical protein
MDMPKFLQHLTLDMEKGPWIAGGAARRLYHGLPMVNADWDIFCSSQKQYDRLVRLCKQYEWQKHSYKTSFEALNGIYISADNPIESRYATTYKEDDHKIQFIHKRFYDTVEDVLNDFDFTVCRYATDGVVFKVGNFAIEDHQNKRLRYTKRDINPLLVGRIVKYRSYGFYLDENLSKLIRDNLDVITYELDMATYDF